MAITAEAELGARRCMQQRSCKRDATGGGTKFCWSRLVKSQTQLFRSKKLPTSAVWRSQRKGKGKKLSPTIKPGTPQMDAAPHRRLGSLARKFQAPYSALLPSMVLIGLPPARSFVLPSDGLGRPLAASLCMVPDQVAWESRRRSHLGRRY